MNPLIALKTYANLIIGALVLALVVVALATISVLRHERDAARIKLVAALQTISDYQKAGQAAALHAADLAQLANETGIEDAAIIEKLKAKIPANDEDARKLAIEAGKTIGELR